MGSYYASERLDSSIELTSKISEDSIVNLKYLLQDITNVTNTAFINFLCSAFILPHFTFE